jgi:hypothetical protein
LPSLRMLRPPTPVAELSIIERTRWMPSPPISRSGRLSLQIGRRLGGSKAGRRG